MKHSHIGLVALAAIAIAGCGGGSDNGSGSGGTQSSPVSLNGVTGFLLGSDNEREIELKSGNNSGPGGSTLRCTPATGSSGCTLTISRAASGGAPTARATGGTIRVTPPSRPQQPSAQPTNTVTQEDVDDALERGRREGEDIGRTQAELEQRAPKWITELHGIAAGDEQENVVVRNKRERSPTVETGSLPLPNKKAAPRVPGSWTGNLYTQKATDRDGQMLYLYTNIASPSNSRRAFWKVYGTEPVTVDNAAANPAVTGRLLSITDSDTGTDGRQFEGLTVSGSYGGTSGTFTCDSCTGTVNAESGDNVETFVTFTGGLEFVSGTWTFEPRNGDRKLLHSRLEDDTYLYFGFWADIPKDAAGTPQFQWIAGGGADGPGNDANLANFANLTGSAKFTGGAVGQYAIGATRSDPAEIGIFTATAELTAEFDKGEDDVDVLSGGITNFRAEDGSSLSGWSISLQRPSDGTTNLEAAGTTGNGNMVSGDIAGDDVTGIWAARLYGVDNAAAPADVECSDPGCAADLSGVAGWFRASSGSSANDVAIGGAFAATPQ